LLRRVVIILPKMRRIAAALAVLGAIPLAAQ
jgi:hypothetical protein